MPDTTLVCSGCSHPIPNGTFPFRIVAHGRPLDCPDAECILLCSIDCMSRWAQALVRMRELELGETAHVAWQSDDHAEADKPIPYTVTDKATNRIRR